MAVYVLKGKVNYGGKNWHFVTNPIINSLLVLQNFTTARKSGNIFLTYIILYFTLTSVVKIPNDTAVQCFSTSLEERNPKDAFH